MNILLKSLTQKKDALVITLAAPGLIQELWKSRTWTNARVFLKAAQATLACLVLQGLNEEDSNENLELQWSWNNSPLKSLTVASLKQGTVRVGYSWVSEDPKDLELSLDNLEGMFQLRRAKDLKESSGVVDSTGDIVKDVQEILLKSQQKDCGLGISVRWGLEEKTGQTDLKIITAHAYLLDVLPPEKEYLRDDILSGWNRFLASLGSPAERVLSPSPAKAVKEMANLITANAPQMVLFSKSVEFYCNCNQTKIENILKILPAEDLQDLEPIVQITCKHCGKVYLVEKSISGLA